MTNVEWFLRLAKRRINVADGLEGEEADPVLTKYELECAVAYLNNAIGILDDEQITNVCQYCGDEAEEDHTCAMCMKG